MNRKRADLTDFYRQKGIDIMKMYPGISFENFKFEMTHTKAYYECKFKLTECEMLVIWDRERKKNKKK